MPTDVMDDNIWGLIVEDIKKGYFDGLWVATPCGSFSPLRENPPGPRPLRSIDRIEGLPEEQLSTQELDQLLTANILVKKSYTAIAYQNRAKKSWGLENPKHSDDKPQLLMMPEIKILAGLRGVRHADFDQCRTGLETTKPTRFLYKRMDLSKLDGLRCDHERRVLSRPDGSTYTAAHESVVQKWVDGPKGRQRASKSQGEYTEELCGIIAGAFHSAASQDPAGVPLIGPSNTTAGSLLPSGDREGEAEPASVGRYEKPFPIDTEAAGHSQPRLDGS